MDFYGAFEVVVKKLTRKAGLNIVDARKGKVKFPSLQGEFVTFLTRDGYGVAPVDNPEDIHWTIHTRRRFPKEKAFLHLFLPLFERPAEFHEKVKGEVTEVFGRRDGYKPFGRFVKERREKYKNRKPED